MAFINAYKKFRSNVSGAGKLGNKKCEYKGMKFDSMKECKRYKQLEMLEKVGEINNLRRQVKFELQPKFDLRSGKHIRSIDYIADFDYYTKDGHYIVEDVKASPEFVPPEFKLKAKMFAHKYGFEITEVYDV